MSCETICIRMIEAGDAAQFLALRTQLDSETRTMMLEPGERAQDLAAQQAELRAVLARERHAIFVVADGPRLVGYLEAEGGQFRCNRHAVIIVAGILREYQGRRIGTRLFQALDVWARAHGIRRLELTVMAHNSAALALYTRIGFAIEGRRICSLIVDGVCVDEFSMARLLPAAPGEETS